MNKNPLFFRNIKEQVSLLLLSLLLISHVFLVNQADHVESTESFIKDVTYLGKRF